MPLLHFKLEVTNTPATQRIHSAMLQAQMQIESTRRTYDAAEKEKLVELFGTPERWGQTLRTRLWAHGEHDGAHIRGQHRGRFCRCHAPTI